MSVLVNMMVIVNNNLKGGDLAMMNKAKFKELILELKEIHMKNKGLVVKLFPIRKSISDIENNVNKVLDEIELDMISIIVRDKEFDIYQKYFENYNIDDSVLTVNFKYNKQRAYELDLIHNGQLEKENRYNVKLA